MTNSFEVAAVRREALSYLACPECGGALKLSNATTHKGRIQEGVLSCACKRSFPIINRVARLLPDVLFNELVEKRHPAKCLQLGVSRTSAALSRVDKEKLATQKAFGFEWLNYPKVYAEYERQFLEWVQPVKPQFFKGKVVLDAGCGTGRHAYFAAKYGAKLVLGLDLSDAVDVAAENTKDFDNVTIVQGDIFHPPFQKKFNYVYSIGVIHHLPSPAGGFASLQRYLVPGGAFSAWLYGREGNTLLPFFDVLRKLMFRRLPLSVTRALAWLGCVAVTAAIHAVYKPVSKVFPFTKKWLPQYDFMRYLGRLNFTVRHSIIFDQMIAPTAFYLRKDEILRWYQDAAMEDVQLTWRNKNSWCAFGKKPAK
jgi:SAM-dependent methyltransferase/uncharacterized protein YbaR (Trm112 family)